MSNWHETQQFASMFIGVNGFYRSIQWGFGPGSFSYYRDTANSVWSYNTWTHVAYTYSKDGDSILYLDGVQVQSFANNGEKLWSRPETMLGAWEQRTGSETYTLDGQIEDARIYRRALTQAEVQQVMLEV